MFFKSANPEERTIIVLADLLIAFLNPEKIIPGLIDKALVEIGEAYHVIMQEGGGWSSDPNKSSHQKRKKAVLEWYQRNQSRLLFLQEPYLKDERLYEDRGGQEKRDFRDILLTYIINHTVKQKLTFHKIRNHIRNLKNTK